MWKTILTTFGTVFLAELGDKTQLATLGLTTNASSKVAVFIGSASALVATSALAVVAGEFIGKHVTPTTLQRAAGVLFLLLGVWTLWKAGRA